MEKLTISELDVDYKDSVFTKVILQRGDKRLDIDFSGALDLHFTLKNCDTDSTFLIGKDNYQVYEVFDKLYNDIISGRVFEPISDFEINMLIEECEWNEEDYHEALRKKLLEKEKEKEEFREKGEKLGLIVDSKIIWRHDDFATDVAPFMIIEKMNESYKLTFDIPKSNRELDIFEESLLNDKSTISVRLRNNGSRYNYFNCCFMRAYQALKEISTDMHQISLEEYMIDKKLESGMKLERILK